MPRTRSSNSTARLESQVRNLSYAVIILIAVVVILSVFSISHQPAGPKTVYVNKTVYISGPMPINITSPLIIPPASLPEDPIITANQSLGDRLTGINQPLNATQLSIINNAPLSYYETAGQMLLNNTIVNTVGASAKNVSPILINGKPSVIYFGSITCIFCGENRWAMALALSKFGSFSSLYQGYSSLGDSDVPTLYWSPAHYNQSSVDLGAFYNSSYINFIAIEDTDPITAGFNLQPFTTIQQEVNSTGNPAYEDSFEYIIQLNNFQGTPYTIWGRSQVGGADAIDFGNTPPTNQTVALTRMTHAQVFQQLSQPNDQFAWTEYAAADVYIAMTCGSINNAAPVCSLPAIREIEKLGY